MAAVFKIDSLDLSVHLKVNQGDGLDPYDGDGFLEPQWSEGGAGDGDSLLSVHEGNAQRSYPLILNPAKAGYANTKDGLALLVRDVNRALKVAQVVEWRDDGATNSTFYDVQFARFDPAYDYRRAGQLWLPGVVHAWTKPYGTTGTSRIVGTAAGSQAAALVSIASGALAGDADADMAAMISLPSGLAANGNLVGLAVGPAAGWTPIWPAASITNGATLLGASGAFASQAARQITGATPNVLIISVGSTTVPAGQHRVIALARTTAATALASAVAMSARLANFFGVALGPTQILPTGRDWRVVDLGVFTGGSTMMPLEAVYVSGGLLTASAAATSSFDVGAVFMIPDAHSVAAFVASGRFSLGPAVGTFAFDGLGRSVRAYVNALNSAVRGDYPQVPVGSGQTVLAFALGDDSPQNSPVSVEIRCREKFAFSR